MPQPQPDISYYRITQLPMCCGAAYWPASNLKPLLESAGSTQELLNLRRVGYILTDKQLPGFEEICPGLYYIHEKRSWKRPVWKPGWGKYPEQPREYYFGKYILPYLVSDRSFLGVNLVCNFPEEPYDFKKNFVDNLKRHWNEHSIATLNKKQAEFCEDLLIEYGFRCVNRTINLQYPGRSHPIALYHRPPGPVQEVEAKV